MSSGDGSLQRRVESLTDRARSLTSLRQLVPLSQRSTLTPRQWFPLEAQLSAHASRIHDRLRRAGKRLAQANDPSARRTLNADLGQLDLELTQAFGFFDTFMDILTQRLSPSLGPLLRGCDVLAEDALRRNHVALESITAPLVYCNRGVGAAVLREGVQLDGLSTNPLPLIQIPYARLQEKVNLTSILHEAGHEALVRLGLRQPMADHVRRELSRAGISSAVRELFALWTSEIGPDLWSFGCCGMAQAAGVRDILSLPPAHMFQLSFVDPHPPPYLRVLLSIEFCKLAFGDGEWNAWERQWNELYPLQGIAPDDLLVIQSARACLPMVARILFDGRYPSLGGRRLMDLFDLPALAPSHLERILQRTGSAPRFGSLRPCTQLAAFRLLRERSSLRSAKLNLLMDKWLLSLPGKSNAHDRRGTQGRARASISGTDVRRPRARFVQSFG